VFTVVNALSGIRFPQSFIRLALEFVEKGAEVYTEA
jgi:hypothetical protein